MLIEGAVIITIPIMVGLSTSQPNGLSESQYLLMKSLPRATQVYWGGIVMS